jgi:hypothetical protein
MEECIAGTVGQLDEAEAFVRVVPLDSSSNGRAGGAVELWTARRRISEIASWWLVVVTVEITAAARAKITVTATHGGTSFSTLRRYSVDHTTRAGTRQTFFDNEVGRIYRVVVDRQTMPRRVAPIVASVLAGHLSIGLSP